ncbi:2-hydroxyhepta-2,4-diene-1,7-dioate isomerase [Rhodococcus sp. 15-649-1-2]|nr:fumarylacetoacetate hydrolase family protein [Rhodococcus sp. 15-649-1-2]OZE79142.1 2-hydroxyhepta-2,4-diene-1,7-dioate isomerase [Rhodococcus sp. 15-649-1-2]
MRLATVRTPDGNRVVVDDGGTVRELYEFASLTEALRAGVLSNPGGFLGSLIEDPSGLDFAPVVSDPGKIICVGHNYREHILEMGHGLPDYPNVFSKFTGALIGAFDDIELSSASTAWDWEAELALVIGSPLRNASVLQAESAIAGYTVANDISARDWQKRASQWLLGKTFDSTTPVGPWMVTADTFGDSLDLAITCTVDGEIVQQSNVSDLLFAPAHLLAYLSTVMTLEPGDLILTGTPSGVGAARTPQLFLRPGQEVRTEIAGIGQCINRCVAANQLTSSI